MGDNLSLVIDWKDFDEQITSRQELANVLIAKKPSIKTAEQLEAITAEIEQWMEETHSFLKNSFNKDRHVFENDFKNARKHRFNIGSGDQPIEQKVRETFEDLSIKKNDLYGTQRILSATDQIINKNTHLLEMRKKYSTEEKLDFVLNKLYDLYDDSSYPIKLLLTGNGVPLATAYEDRELASFLEQSGYIGQSNGPAGISAQLTVQGRLYVEGKRKATRENYDDIKMSPEELAGKIDHIIHELNKQGLGQEIIFNEIEELKELYTQLNKKNWGQIVKGKLFDIGTSQALDIETLGFIYEKLTSHHLNLL